MVKSLDMVVEGMGARDRFSVSDEDEDKSEASESEEGEESSDVSQTEEDDEVDVGEKDEKKIKNDSVALFFSKKPNPMKS